MLIVKSKSLLSWVAGVVLANMAAWGAGQLGDPAPALSIVEWVKGGPVDLASGKGKTVFVVEFWATWCSPCRASIPHLTELQKKFKEKNVVFVGVSDEKPAVVKPFVEKMGAKMEYAVAVDKDRATSKAYMEAYGIDGIPHAFVVDKEGRVVWEGHPMGDLEATLTSLVAGTFDLAKSKKRAEAQKLIEEFWELAGDEAKTAEADALGRRIEALDQELGGIMPGRTFKAAEVRQQVRFSGAMQEYQRAMVQGKDDATLAELEKKAIEFAPAGFDFAEMKQSLQIQVTFQRYMRLAQATDADAAQLAALAEKLAAIKTKNGMLLNEMAWTLLTDEGIRKRDLPLAGKLAQAAKDASEGKDASILDTYAKWLFESGKVAEALEWQQKAVALCEDADMKNDLEARLREYREKADKK